LRWSDIPFRPGERMLKQFAGLWLVFFGVLAAWEGLVRGRPMLAAALAVMAVLVGGLGLMRPGLIRPIFVAWMVLAFPIGWTVSQVTLTLIFYGIFTPVGIILRLTGRDPLHRARHPEAQTYWSPKVQPTDTRRYFKQF
jgi:hypothetical protein